MLRVAPFFAGSGYFLARDQWWHVRVSRASKGFQTRTFGYTIRDSSLTSLCHKTLPPISQSSGHRSS
jgi:hypothetical protein